MTDDMENILNRKWTTINITNAELPNVILSVPRQPGLYIILTTTPKEVLRQFKTRKDAKHYNLLNKICASDSLPDKFKIQQKDNDLYTVYNGHHSNLRQRLSEHFKGSQGTGCLAIFEIELLRNYKWAFEYLDLSVIENYSDSKLLRTYLEQTHRSKIGWPILCGQ